MEIIYENGALPEIQSHLVNFIMLSLGYAVTIVFACGVIYTTCKALVTRNTFRNIWNEDIYCDSCNKLLKQMSN